MIFPSKQETMLVLKHKSKLEKTGRYMKAGMIMTQRKYLQQILKSVEEKKVT